MPFRELTTGRKKMIGLQSASAERSFVPDPSGPVSVLPEHGNVHPEEEFLHVTEITEEQFGDTPDKVRSTVRYTSSSLKLEEEELGNEASGTNFGLDNPREIDIGGEFFSVRDVSGWTWKNQATSIKDQPMFKRIVTGTLRIMKVFNKLPIERIVKFAGHVNSETFPNIPGIPGLDKEVWLFTAAPATEIKSFTGKQNWKVTFHFSFRFIAEPGTGTNLDDLPTFLGGWNHVWNEDTDQWDVPLDSQSNRIYDAMDLNDLFKN